MSLATPDQLRAAYGAVDMAPVQDQPSPGLLAQPMVRYAGGAVLGLVLAGPVGVLAAMAGVALYNRWQRRMSGLGRAPYGDACDRWERRYEKYSDKWEDKGKSKHERWMNNNLSKGQEAGCSWALSDTTQDYLDTGTVDTTDAWEYGVGQGAAAAAASYGPLLAAGAVGALVLGALAYFGKKR